MVDHVKVMHYKLPGGSVLSHALQTEVKQLTRDKHAVTCPQCLDFIKLVEEATTTRRIIPALSKRFELNKEIKLNRDEYERLELEYNKILQLNYMLAEALENYLNDNSKVNSDTAKEALYLFKLPL